MDHKQQQTVDSPKADLNKYQDSIRLNKRGSVAIEFALIFPILLLIYTCSVEIYLAYSAKRAVAQTSATISNIIATYSTFSKSSDLPKVLSTIGYLMFPEQISYTDANFDLLIAGLRLGKGGTLKKGKCSLTQNVLPSRVEWIMRKSSAGMQMPQTSTFDNITWDVGKSPPKELGLASYVRNNTEEISKSVLKPCEIAISTQISYRYRTMFAEQARRIFGADTLRLQHIYCCSRQRSTDTMTVSK